MKRLGVNIDHVATIRQARHTAYPDVCEAARIAMQAGADQITIHLREDRRHIQDADLGCLKDVVTVPLNLEMAAVDAITTIACQLKPERVTLVPERREELTTEGGLKVAGNDALLATVARFKDTGIVVSLFIDPEKNEIDASLKLQVEAVELHTGAYCEASSETEQARELERIVVASQHAHAAGFEVAAGHGLHYDNTHDVVVAAPLIEEYNIGHAIIARAVFIGLEEAVREIKALLEE